MNDAQAIHKLDQATGAASDMLDQMIEMTPADQPVHEIATAIEAGLSPFQAYVLLAEAIKRLVQHDQTPPELERT